MIEHFDEHPFGVMVPRNPANARIPSEKGSLPLRQGVGGPDGQVSCHRQVHAVLDDTEQFAVANRLACRAPNVCARAMPSSMNPASSIASNRSSMRLKRIGPGSTPIAVNGRIGR